MSDNDERKPPGRSRWSGGCGGKGRSSKSSIDTRRQSWRDVARPKFLGEYEDMGGYIFDIGVPNQAELFSFGQRKLANYIGRTAKEPQDIRLVRSWRM